MKKFLIYGGFGLASVGVIAVFITATSYLQLAIASVLYIPLAFFVFRYLIPHLPRKVDVKTPIVATRPIGGPDSKELEIVDIDKRAFLKIIGAAGLSFFIFSLFTRKIEALLPGNLGPPVSLPQNTNNTQTSPAGNQPTDNYKISEVDNGIVSYYGFVSQDSGWYIMKEDDNEGSFRYAKGKSNFPDNWANRTQLKYDYYSNVFS